MRVDSGVRDLIHPAPSLKLETDMSKLHSYVWVMANPSARWVQDAEQWDNFQSSLLPVSQAL